MKHNESLMKTPWKNNIKLYNYYKNAKNIFKKNMKNKGKYFEKPMEILWSP